MEFLAGLLEHLGEHGWEFIADKLGDYLVRHPAVAATAAVIIVPILVGALVFGSRRKK